MKLDLSKFKLTLKVTNDKPKRVRTIQSKEIPPKKLTKLVNGRVIINSHYAVTFSCGGLYSVTKGKIFTFCIL